MPHYDIAHINEQGIDLVIVPLDASYGYKSSADQNRIASELQRRANGAGLRGTVVPVWDTGGGMGYLAPRNYQPFFQSISMDYVLSRINRELSW